MKYCLTPPPRWPGADKEGGRELLGVDDFGIIVAVDGQVGIYIRRHLVQFIRLIALYQGRRLHVAGPVVDHLGGYAAPCGEACAGNLVLFGSLFFRVAAGIAHGPGHIQPALSQGIGIYPVIYDKALIPQLIEAHKPHVLPKSHHPAPVLLH